MKLMDSIHRYKSLSHELRSERVSGASKRKSEVERVSEASNAEQANE